MGITNSSSIASTTNESTQLTVDKLLKNEIQVVDIPEVQDLEHFREQSRTALASTSFDSLQEQELATCVQNNVDGWIDTAHNCLNIAVHLGALANTYLGQNPGANVPQPLMEHGLAIYENTKQIYIRATEQAINNSNVLLAAIEANENTRNHPAVQTAALQYKSDVNLYRQGKVDMAVPKQSHSKLVESIKQVEPDPNALVRKKAEESSMMWKIAAGIGAILVIVGGVAFALLAKR